MRYYRYLIYIFLIGLIFSGSISAYEATFYSDAFDGKRTAYGDVYGQNNFSAAFCNIPLGSLAYVAYGGTGLVVKVNDRPNCQASTGTIDLSKSAFSLFAPLSLGRLYDVKVRPLAVTIPEAYKKSFLTSDTFGELNVLLSPQLPNTYLAGETIRFTGKVLDGNKNILVYLKKEGQEYKFSELFPVKSDGTFESYIVLPESGTYTLIVTSGNEFNTTLSEKIFILDPRGLIYGDLPSEELAVSPKPQIRSGTFGLTSDENIWSRYSIFQDNNEISAAGRGFTIFPTTLGLRSGPARLEIESFRLSTPFSIDRSTMLMDTTDTVLIDRLYPNDNKVGAKAILFRKNIVVTFTVPNGKNVIRNWYVTFPDGSVKQYTLPETSLNSRGFIEANRKIQLTVPAAKNGTYLIEAVDETGVAYFNIPMKVGSVWNILEPITTEMRQLVRKNLRLVRLTSLQSLNRLRAGQGLDLLIDDADLARIAQEKALDMAARNYIGHVNPEGKRIGDLLSAAHIEYTSVGENVAGGSIINGRTNTPSPISDIVLVDGLELSGSHRYNMLRRDWTKAGIGYATANGKSYYVQVFGK